MVEEENSVKLSSDLHEFQVICLLQVYLGWQNGHLHLLYNLLLPFAPTQ